MQHNGETQSLTKALPHVLRMRNAQFDASTERVKHKLALLERSASDKFLTREISSRILQSQASMAKEQELNISREKSADTDCLPQISPLKNFTSKPASGSFLTQEILSENNVQKGNFENSRASVLEEREPKDKTSSEMCVCQIPALPNPLLKTRFSGLDETLEENKALVSKIAELRVYKRGAQILSIEDKPKNEFPTNHTKSEEHIDKALVPNKSADAAESDAIGYVRECGRVFAKEAVRKQVINMNIEKPSTVIKPENDVTTGQSRITECTDRNCAALRDNIITILKSELIKSREKRNILVSQVARKDVYVKQLERENLSLKNENTSMRSELKNIEKCHDQFYE